MHKTELLWRSLLATFTTPGILVALLVVLAFAWHLRQLSRNPEVNPRKLHRRRRLLPVFLVVFTCVCALVAGHTARTLNNAVVNSQEYRRLRFLCAHPIIPLELKRKVGKCERWDFGIPRDLYDAKWILRDECKRPGVRERAQGLCIQIEDSKEEIEFHSFRAYCADPRFTAQAQERTHFPRCRELGLKVPFSPEEQAAVIREECLTLSGRAFFNDLCPPIDWSTLGL